MAGLHEVPRPALGVDRDLDRVRAVVRGDAGRDAVARLDRDRERRFERRLVLGRHQVEAELVAALGRQRQADQPAPLLGHEVDRLRASRTARPASGRPRSRGSRRRRRRPSCPGGSPRSPARSSRTAWWSASSLMRVPPAAARRAWRGCRPRCSRAHPRRSRRGSCAASVSGISDTAKPPSLSALTVRLTPSSGDRALLDQVAREPRLGVDLEHAREALLADRADRAGAVDVALHDVPAEAILGAQRRARGSRARPARSCAERGALERLGHRLRAGSRPASTSVAVRQTPLTAIESPSASSRGERAGDPQRRARAVALERPRRCPRRRSAP